MNHEGPDLKADLLTVLTSISRFCGSPSIVLVKPPLFAMWATSKEPYKQGSMWPAARIPQMKEVLHQAFAQFQQNRTFRIVDAQLLSKPEDFDIVGHFCIFQKDCATNLEISRAILQAVQVVALTPAIPGLHIPRAANASSNTST
mmetsp:Transcript_117225/g.226109  ORF Transcript_117225/g.226109 Transcript_117225/m.226109 type:complete len:145 (-) Transcript_117225:32-466(-)